MKETTFAVACKEFFGFKPQQTMTEFMQELKELTPEDKATLSKDFEKVGYKIVQRAI